jgi:chaperonin GroES
MLNIKDILPKLFESNTKPKSLLEEYAEKSNIVDDLDENTKQTLVNRVIAGIEEDKQTQAKWLADVKDVQRLVLLSKEPKNTPLPQSANIKLPIITDACYQYAARTYPEIVQDGQVVKTMVTAQDSSGLLSIIANAIQTHMNWQLLGPDAEWESSMDKLLVVYSNIGFILKKTYYDSIKYKNVSNICHYEDIILRNAPDIQCLNDLRRITHVLHWNTNDLITAARSGIFCEEAVSEILAIYTSNNKFQECDLYESHCFFDLDEDGYEEPYIITVHKSTRKLCRVKARYDKDCIKLNDDGKVICIEPEQYFTDYHFLPSPDGCFMSVGFGTLLQHLQEMGNTICNELIDAGALANMQTGFMDSRIRVIGGNIEGTPGSWTKVKGVLGQQLKEGMFPIIYKEPSSVLFQLFGQLIEMSKELTSSTDAMQGMGAGTNVPATTQLSMIEQGMKRFSAIQKRLYRSLKEEFQKLYKLNKKYVDPEEFLEVVGNIGIDSSVYKNPHIKITPIADPNLSSDAQRLSQAQVIMGIASQPTSLISQYEAQKRMLEAAKVSNIAALLPPQAKNAPPKPDPKMIQIQSKNEIDKNKLILAAKHQQTKEQETTAKVAKTSAEIQQMHANSAKLIAEASATSDSTKLKELGLQLDSIKTKINSSLTANKQVLDHSTSMHKLALENKKVDSANAQAILDAHQGYEQLSIDRDTANANRETTNREVSDNSVDGTSSNQEDDGNTSGP